MAAGSERRALNAAIAQSFAALQSGKPLSILVEVEDVAVAIEEAERMGVMARVEDEQTVTLLLNQPTPAHRPSPPEVTEPTVAVPADVAELIAQTQAAIDATEAAIAQRDEHDRIWQSNAFRFYVAVAAWALVLVIALAHPERAKVGVALACLATLPLLVGGIYMAARGDRP